MTKPQFTAEEWSDGFREGVQYAMEYLAEVYGLDDIEETTLWEEYGDENE